MKYCSDQFCRWLKQRETKDPGGFRKTLAFAEVISFAFAGGKFLCGLGGYGDHAGSGDLP